MTEQLRDEVAKAMIRRNFPSLSEADVAEMVDCWLPDAEAAIAIVLERAATMAENPAKPDDYTMEQWAAAQTFGDALAAEFRRLAAKP